MPEASLDCRSIRRMVYVRERSFRIEKPAAHREPPLFSAPAPCWPWLPR
jgi:hypothetical protein